MSNSKSYQFGKELFACTNCKQTEVGQFELNVASPNDGPDYRSKARGNISQPIKISKAAFLFDLIFGDEAKTVPRLAVYELKDLVYVVIDGVGYYINAERPDVVKTTGKPAHYRTMLVPFVIFAMCIGEYALKGTTEIMDTFSEYAMDVFDAQTKGTLLQSANLYKFCDAFYYAFAKPIGSFTVDEGGISEAEVQRMFDNGLWKYLLGLDESMFAQSKFEGLLETSAPAKETEKKSAKKTSKKKGEKSFWQKCLDGEFKLDHEWDEEQQKLIPKIPDDFIITTEFEELLSNALTAVMEGKPLTAEMFGKPGTGKTYSVMVLAAVLGMPYYPILFSRGTDETVTWGATVIEDGHPAFTPTDIPKFWDKGGIYGFEELNAADDNALIVFNMALEAPGVIMRNAHEKVYRNPLSFVFACMNTGIEGMNPLPPALSDRMDAKWNVPDPTEDEFKAILKTQTGASDKCVEWVYEAYSQITHWLKDADETDMLARLSMRGCRGCIKNMQSGQNPLRALHNSLVGSIAEKDAGIAAQIEDEVVKTLLKEPDFKVKKKEDVFSAFAKMKKAAKNK